MKNLSMVSAYCFMGGAGADGGAYSVPSPKDGKPLTIIASIGFGWDHVSVSRKDRVPNWYEMEHVKRMFFEDHECAMQLHPPLDDYVDGSIHGHPNCLHLWKSHNEPIPRPPKWMVGGMSMEEANKLADQENSR